MNVPQVMVDAIKTAPTHQVHISAAATEATPKVDISVKVGSRPFAVHYNLSFS